MLKHFAIGTTCRRRRGVCTTTTTIKAAAAADPRRTLCHGGGATIGKRRIEEINSTPHTRSGWFWEECDSKGGFLEPPRGVQCQGRHGQTDLHLNQNLLECYERFIRLVQCNNIRPILIIFILFLCAIEIKSLKKCCKTVAKNSAECKTALKYDYGTFKNVTEMGKRSI